MVQYRTLGDRVFNLFNALLMLGVIFLCLFPIIHLIAISFSSKFPVVANMVTFWPIGFTTDSYELVTADSGLWVAYRNTIYYAVLGTIIQLTVVTMAAYPLSKPRLKARSAVTFFFVFTILFSGGLIPTYIIVDAVGLRNTVWALVLPNALSVWHLLIMRTYFQGLPDELEDAATVDGLGNLGILLRIYVPLAVPVYAAFVVFFAVAHWNAYFWPLIFLDEQSRYPLQVILREIIIANNMADLNIQYGGRFQNMEILSETVKAATVIFVIGPILLVYPLMQRYFVKGMMLGSIKG